MINLETINNLKLSTYTTGFFFYSEEECDHGKERQSWEGAEQ
jgi:hypothetical protein